MKASSYEQLRYFKARLNFECGERRTPPSPSSYGVSRLAASQINQEVGELLNGFVEQEDRRRNAEKV